MTVVEAGSFTRAAQRLHIAQPALSRQIKLLEEELGADLVSRASRQIKTTDAGELLLKHAKELIAGFQRVEREMQSRQKRPQGRVVIGIPPSLGPLLIPRVVERVRSNYPQISLCFREATTVGLEKWLDTAEIDIGLLGDEPTMQDKDAVKIAQEEIALIGRHDLLKAINGAASQFCSIPLILTGQAKSMLHPIFRCIGVELPQPLEIDALHVIKEIVLRGEGVTVLPVALFRSEIEFGELAAARFKGVNLSRSLYMSRSNEKRSQAVDALFATMCSELKALASEGALSLTGIDVPQWDSLLLRMIEPEAPGSKGQQCASSRQTQTRVLARSGSWVREE